MQQEPSPDTGALFRTFESSEPSFSAPIDLTIDGVRSIGVWPANININQEYETAREEMQATNEELQSMNEELRATAEELETRKEEMQSINEELMTVNQENKHRISRRGRQFFHAAERPEPCTGGCCPAGR